MEIGKPVRTVTYPRREREKPIVAPNWPKPREEPIPVPDWPTRKPVRVPIGPPEKEKV